MPDFILNEMNFERKTATKSPATLTGFSIDLKVEGQK